MKILVLLFSILSLRDVAIAEDHLYWEKDPLFAYMLLSTEQVDRNGDGKPDFWKSIKGDSREIAFDTTLRNGSPNLVFTFSGPGPWVKQVETFEVGEFSQLVTEVVGANKHGRIVTVSKYFMNSDQIIVEKRTPLTNGGIQVETTIDGKTILSEQGGEYSHVTFYENEASNCLADSPNNLLRPTTVNQILHRLADGINVASNCENVVLGNGNQAIRFNTAADLKNELQSIINQGQQCMRALKDQAGNHSSQQATRLADEMLANVFADADRRNASQKLTVTCNVPDEAKKSIYARATDVNQSHFPELMLNPQTLNKTNYGQIVMHEMLHMSGTPGHSHTHNYDDPSAPDLAQACAVCCFPGDTQLVNQVSTDMNLDLSNTQELRNRSCNICAGHYSLAQQQVEYARTEMAQGNMTSYRLAAFELRKAVVNDPNNVEAWRLLAHAMAQVRPKLIDRDAKIVLAFRKAIELEQDAQKKQQLQNHPTYLAVLNRMKSSNDNGPGLLDLHRYIRTDQNDLEPVLKDKIVDLEVERAHVRVILQSCPDFRANSSCSDQLHDAFIAYKGRLDALKQTNSSLGRLTDKIHDSMMDGVSAEYNRHVRMYRCVNDGNGTVRSCFMQYYNNPPKTSTDYMDWFNRP